VVIGASGLRGGRPAALIDGAQLKVYPGAPHGVIDTHEDQRGADLLEFLHATNERTPDESCHVHA